MRRALFVVTCLTALSQLAAFFKLWLTARYFGVGSEIDGYNLALVVPTLVSGVIGGIIQTGLFPVRAKLATHQSSTEVERFERNVLWICTAIGLLFFLLIYAAAEPIAQLLAGSTSIATRQAFIFVLTSCAILACLNIVNDCIGYLLAFRGKFAYAAGAPILNGLLGGAIIVFWIKDGIAALVCSTLIGTFAQLAVCTAGLMSLKFRIYGRTQAKEALNAALLLLKTGGWIIPGVIISNITATFPAVWAANFGEGAVSAFSYAYRMHTSAIQLFVMASSIIILTRLSELHARNDHGAIAKLIQKSAALSFALGITAVLATWVFGSATLQLLFGGKFDASAATRVASIWTCLSLGLGFSLLGNVVSKLWQAQRRAKLMSLMAAVCLGFAIVFQSLLSPITGEFSIPLSLSLMAAANVAIGLRLLNLPPHRVDE